MLLLCMRLLHVAASVRGKLIVSVLVVREALVGRIFLCRWDLVLLLIKCLRVQHLLTGTCGVGALQNVLLAVRGLVVLGAVKTLERGTRHTVLQLLDRCNGLLLANTAV